MMIIAEMNILTEFQNSCLLNIDEITDEMKFYPNHYRNNCKHK
jgi:hypothetical protein